MPIKGYKQTPEHKARISASKLGRSLTLTTEQRERRRSLSKRHGFQKGQKKSTETRRRISEGHLGQIPWNKGLPSDRWGHKDDCGCAVHAPYNPSNLSWRMIEVFLNEFEIVVPEQLFGRYTVDAYLPEEHVAFEADGSYWHDKPGKRQHDTERDEYLLNEFGLPVVRLSEQEINEAHKEWSY